MRTGLKALVSVLFVATAAALDPAGFPDTYRQGQTPSGLEIPEPQSCEADGTCKEAAAVASLAPASDWFRSGSAQHVSPELYDQINANLTALNASALKLRCYVAIIDDQPEEEGGRAISPREFARKRMREWYGGERNFQYTLMVLLIRATNRTEIVLGMRARKRMKEAQVRRIARKANELLAEGGEGPVDDALRHVVTHVLKALKKEKGMAGSLRAMLMPLIIGAVLLYLYFKNQGARFNGGGQDRSMGGGVSGGMDGIEGMMMGGGMGGMGGMGSRGGAGVEMRGMAGRGEPAAEDDDDCSGDEYEGEVVDEVVGAEDAEPPAASAAGGETRQDRPSPLVAKLRARAAVRRGN